MSHDPQWIHTAIRKIEADFQRSADTHLIKLDIPSLDGIDIYLKDESTHPTGSLKHRLARSLFLFALCNGWIAKIPRSLSLHQAVLLSLKPTLLVCLAYPSLL